MSEIDPLRISQIVECDYKQSLENIGDWKKELKSVQKGIYKYTSPMIPVMHYFRQDWKDLTRLVDREIVLVNNIGGSLEAMTKGTHSCAEELGAYSHLLMERREECLEERGRLEKEFSEIKEGQYNGFLERISHGVKVIKYNSRKKKTEAVLHQMDGYFEGLERLTYAINQLHGAFATSTDLVRGSELHLREIRNSYLATIETLKKGKDVREVLGLVGDSVRKAFDIVDQVSDSVSSAYEQSRLVMPNSTLRINLLNSRKTI